MVMVVDARRLEAGRKKRWREQDDGDFQGGRRIHCHRFGTTASMTTSSTAKTVQIAQLAILAALFQIWLTSDCSTAMTGMTSSAATRTGSSKRFSSGERAHPRGATSTRTRFRLSVGPESEHEVTSVEVV